MAIKIIVSYKKPINPMTVRKMMVRLMKRIATPNLAMKRPEMTTSQNGAVVAAGVVAGVAASVMVRTTNKLRPPTMKVSRQMARLASR